MTIHARSLVLHGAALSGLLLLSACGKHENPPPATPPAASTAAAPGVAHTAPMPAHTAPMPAAAATAPATPATGSTAATPASAGTSAAATQAPAPFKVDAVTLGEAVTAGYKISKPGTTFAPTQSTIYTSVATSGSTTGATLSAHFSYLEGKGQDVTTISQTIATDGPATTTFKLRNPNQWPAGKYKVEIAIDGKPVTSQTFEIKAA